MENFYFVRSIMIIITIILSLFICDDFSYAAMDRYGGVFHDGTDTQDLHSDLTWSGLNFLFKTYGVNGKKLVDVEIIQRESESSENCNAPTFAGVWRQGDYGQSIIGGLAWADFNKAVQEQRGNGMKLVDIETHLECGVRKFVGVFNETPSRGEREQVIKSSMNWDLFSAFFASRHSAGYHLVDMETYVDNGARYWVAIWDTGPKDEWLFAWGRQEFEKNLAGSLNGSQRLVDMESWLDEGGRMIAGLFYKSPDPAIMETGESWQKFNVYWNNQVSDKKILVDLEVYPDTTDKRWENAFNSTFNDKIMGWQFTLYEDGVKAASGAQGWARSPNASSNPSLPMKTSTKINVASVAKLLTTIGVLELNEQYGNTILDTPFAFYMQNVYTEFGAGVWAITVRHLLTQESGMAKLSNEEFEALGSSHEERIKAWVAMDIVKFPGQGNAFYYNQHYDLLFRVIEVITGQQFGKWMNENVFSKLGLDYLYCHHSQFSDSALYYKFLPDTSSGTHLVTYGDTCFHGSWYASTDDIAKIVASFRTGALLEPASVNIMRSEVMAQYPWWQNPSIYTHNGGLCQNPGYGMGSYVMSFPDGIDLALNMNSWPGPDCNSVSISVEQLMYDTWLFPEDW